MNRLAALLLAALVLGATAAAQAATISGTVLDARTGRPLAGIAVAAAAYDGDFRGPMAGEAPPSPLEPGSTAVTNADGSYTVTLGDGIPWIALDVYGAPRGFVTYHGIFAAGTARIPVIRLIAPTEPERRALAQLNAFRRAPGGNAAFGDAQPLVFDQNLVLVARYWAGEERRAHRIGHTCAQLGEPAGCIEFDAYFHALPGAPPFDDPGQNAAFDPDPSWGAADELFEIEGGRCGYDWRDCRGGADGTTAQTGHYVNLMSARRWIGMGEAPDGDGMYFAQNLL